MTQEDIIARVRALLAKASDSGATEAEAASAAAAAEKLLARHAMEMRDVLDPGIVERKTGIRYLEPWVRVLAVHAARLYGCEPLVTREFAMNTRHASGKPRLTEYRSMSVYGRPASTEVAASMIDYLVATVVRMSRDHSSVRKDQLGFQRGAGERIAHRLWEMREAQEARAESTEGAGDGTSLIVVEQSEAKSWMQENMRTSPTRNTNSDTSGRSAHAGWSAGGSVHLGGQIAGQGAVRIGHE